MAGKAATKERAKRHHVHAVAAEAKAVYQAASLVNGYGEAKAKLNAYGIDAVCDAVISGETLTGIGKRIGVSVGVMFEWLSADPERYARAREARAKAAAVWDEQALEAIAKAQDTLELGKAKEIAYHLRWRASKLAPRDYGDRVAVDHGVSQSLVDLVRGSFSAPAAPAAPAPLIIEGEAESGDDVT